MPSLSLSSHAHQNLPELVRSATALTPEVIAVDEQLAACLPYRGFRRGDTVMVAGSNTLTLLAIAHATTEGLWCGMVSLPQLNFATAHEIGADLARIVAVPDAQQHAPTVAATLLDTLDMVVVGLSQLNDPLMLRKLSARARQRRKLLLLSTTSPTDVLPSVTLTLTAQRHTWRGIDDGLGYLTEHTLDIVVSGQGRANKPRQHTLAVITPDAKP